MPSPAWVFTRTSPYRRNVLDLLRVFGSKALTSYIFCDIDMSAVKEERRKFAASNHRVTVTAFLLKAICVAQKSFPESRTFCFARSRLVTLEKIVAGFTVEKEMADGPAVFFGEIDDASEKSVVDFASELETYAAGDVMLVPKLREQKQFAEMPVLVRELILFLAYFIPAFRLKFMGATFGLSSLGSLGMTSATGPSVCTAVFGVGAVTDRVVVQNNEIVVRPVLTLSLSFDQRAMNASSSARFLKRVKELLEEIPVEHFHRNAF